MSGAWMQAWTSLVALRVALRRLKAAPEGYRPGCPREECPCHVPGPVCAECVCIRPETGPYCPRCGWHHDKHVTEGGRDGAR